MKAPLTGREEAGGVEVPEDGEAVDEDEEGDPADTPVREVRLQLAVVDELCAVETLRTHAAVFGARVSCAVPQF